MDNSEPTGAPPLVLRAPGTLDAALTFERFVVGESNRFAEAACRSVAERPGAEYNPLLIHGGRGVGKTHLATAIGHALLARAPGARVTQLSADAFMRELLAALRADRTESFKRHLRDVDLLIVDDVQLLAGRLRTQEEFFHTFNALHDQDRQMVLTSDRAPKAIPRLEERLCNRFEWGLVVDLQPLDRETKRMLLRRYAAEGGFALPEDVVTFLATVAEDPRDLQALAFRVRARAARTGRRIGMDVAREAAEASRGDAAVSLDAIARAVCEQFALRPAELRSRRRTQDVAVPRQLAMYLCRRLALASYPRIAERFGRDHATVIHATRATERRRKTDPAFHATVEQLERRIRGE